MKPDKKFMNLDNDDLEFVPFDVTNSLLKNNSNFFPLAKDDDFRNNNNHHIALPFLNNFISSDSNELHSYNKNIGFRSLSEDDSNDIVPIPSDILMDLGLSDDEFDELNRTETSDLDINDTSDVNDDDNRHKRCNPNVVFRKIQRNNPEILNTMRRYRIPFPIAKRMIMRIIRLSLRYCDCNKYNTYYDFDRE